MLRLSFYPYPQTVGIVRCLAVLTITRRELEGFSTGWFLAVTSEYRGRNVVSEVIIGPLKFLRKELRVMSRPFGEYVRLPLIHPGVIVEDNLVSGPNESASDFHP